MTKHWSIALAAVLSVLPVLISLASPEGMIFIIFAPLPLFFIGLGYGPRAGWTAGGIAAVLWGLIGGIQAAAGVAMTMIAPVCVLVWQALRSRPTKEGDVEWYPPGLLVAWLTGFGLIWLTACFLVLAAQFSPSGMEEALRLELKPILSQLVPAVEPSRLDALTEAAAAWGLGMTSASWMVLLLALNGVLAEGILLRFGRAIRPAPDIAQLNLPAWPVWILAAACVVAVVATGWPAFVARNAAITMLVPFFFAGLAVMHSLCRRFRASGVALAVFYVALLLWAAVLPAGLAVLGLIDQWAGFRRRFLARPSGREEE